MRFVCDNNEQFVLSVSKISVLFPSACRTPSKTLVDEKVSSRNDTARVQKAIALSAAAFGPTEKPSGLLSLSLEKKISSPLKESLSGTDSPKNHPSYCKDWFDVANNRWIKFKPVTEVITVSVSREELSKILNFGINEEGLLDMPFFVKGSSRADFIRQNFSKDKPKHFFPKYLRDRILKLNRNVEKLQGKRGGKSRKLPYLVHIMGCCEATVDGCEATFDAGITEEDLYELASGNTDSV